MKEILKWVVKILIIILLMLYSLLLIKIKQNSNEITNDDIIEEIETLENEESFEDEEQIAVEEMQETTENVSEEQTIEVKEAKKQSSNNNSNNNNKYKITHYGFDCTGCSGKTATGYDVSNTIYYNDTQYGQVRIVAMSKKIPLYSIIKIENYKYGGDIIAIVLDRGVSEGIIDLFKDTFYDSGSVKVNGTRIGCWKNITVWEERTNQCLMCG